MHIVLADDHALVREMIRDYLQKIYKDAVIIEASTFDETLDCADKADGLDLVLLDYMMPGMNGAKSIGELSQRHPDVAVAILSGTICRADVMTAIKSGARGVIAKTISGKSLAKVIELILSGDTYIPSFMLDGPDILAEEPPEAVKNIAISGAHLKDLTRREIEVLALLVEGHPNKVIARELDICEVTAKVHLKNIFKKFGVCNRGQAIRTALTGDVRNFGT